MFLNKNKFYLKLFIISIKKIVVISGHMKIDIDDKYIYIKGDLLISQRQLFEMASIKKTYN